MKKKERIRKLEERIAELEGRIAKLESRPSYIGVGPYVWYPYWQPTYPSITWDWQSDLGNYQTTSSPDYLDQGTDWSSIHANTGNTLQ